MGISPRILCIIAKCSRLSWVWNKVIPKYNSNKIHPIDQTSQGCAHPNSATKMYFMNNVNKVSAIAIWQVNISNPTNDCLKFRIEHTIHFLHCIQNKVILVSCSLTMKVIKRES